MSRTILVAYFSISGITAKAAGRLAELVGGDIYEIKPEIPYTQMDLDWKDQKSRSSVEMKDPSSRPAIAGKLPDVEKYDVVFAGFPVWWYVAPTIINTFLESFNLTGKTIIPFATSGGSGMGETNIKLQPSCPGATLLPGKVLNGMQDADLKAWVESMNSLKMQAPK